MSALAAFALTTLTVHFGSPVGSPPAPADLVKKLGDKSFKIRHDAAYQLVRQGSAAVPALMDGTRDPDPEVSERCRLLLPQAEALERNEKLTELLRDPAAAPPKGLAGLEQFLKITGDSRVAREVYAELMGIFFEGMEAREKDAKKAGEIFQQFCDEAYARYRASIQTGRYSPDAAYNTPADITFFYVMAGDTRLKQSGLRNSGRGQILLNGTKVQTGLTSGERAPVMKKLFLHWLENEPESYMQSRGFQLAAQAKLPEALPIAVKLLEKKDQLGNSYGKAQIMTTLVGLATKDHIRLVEPYLTNKDVVTTVNFGNGKQTTVQLRDVAMGVCVQLAGQKPLDYGFDTSQFGGGFSPSSYIYYGFSDDKSRDDAHAKWKDWATKNLKPDGKTPEAKTGEGPKKVDGKVPAGTSPKLPVEKK
jgi:hypothetical protein